MTTGGSTVVRFTFSRRPGRRPQTKPKIDSRFLGKGLPQRKRASFVQSALDGPADAGGRLLACEGSPPPALPVVEGHSQIELPYLRERQWRLRCSIEQSTLASPL